MSLDSIACVEIVRDTLDRRGVVWTWDHLLVPVLVGVGRRWENTGSGVEVEHVLSESITAALTGVVARLRAPGQPAARAPRLRRRARCTRSRCSRSSAALAERHIGARVLGARVPREALVAAIRRTGPAAVLVWALRASAPARSTSLAELPALRPAPWCSRPGPGWEPSRCPRASRTSTDLVGAVARIAHAVGV